MNISRYLIAFKTIIFALLVTIGCGGGPVQGTGGAGGSLTHVVRLDVGEITVQPGEEVAFMCDRTHTTDELFVAGFSFEGWLSDMFHHFTFAEDRAPKADGLSVCSSIVEDTWVALAANGTTDQPIKIPEEAALRIAKGAGLVKSMHLLNTSNTVKTVKPAVLLDVYPPEIGKTKKPVAVMGFNALVLTVPAFTSGYVLSYTAVADKLKKSARIFMLFPHGHQHLADWSFSRNGEKVAGGVYNYGNQTLQPASIVIEPNDELGFSFTFNNPDAVDYHYGPSATDDEMDALFMQAVVEPGDEGLHAFLDLDGDGVATSFYLAPSDNAP